ncbi:hypothetical protein CS022_16905 [Veronia nyctiphanis]|uniref:Uncharacterized protein n=1 Tax=Veronia nyctiphanis TaxID=1278244 RepID=A0A4Q0YSZ1_9GAMM|nr:hypothetical protein [Veronia nyctiphanis]RXJ72229.1 hypothetical protein CS022_16905 [Veronia nyctiphanis]
MNSLANDLCCMQLLYAQATQPDLRQRTNDLYGRLVRNPDSRDTLRDEYYVPNSALHIVKTKITMTESYADNLVQISGSPVASVLVNKALGEVAYRCVFSVNREPSFILADGIFDAEAPTLTEEQQKALVLVLWHLALNDGERGNFLRSDNKSEFLQKISVDNLNLEEDVCSHIAKLFNEDDALGLKNYIGYWLYKATW